MALVGLEGSLVWAVLAGHKDSQAGLKVDLEKVVHEGEPLERVNLKDSHTHRTDMEKHKWVYHPMHNVKNMSG